MSSERLEAPALTKLGNAIRTWEENGHSQIQLMTNHGVCRAAMDWPGSSKKLDLSLNLILV